MRKLLLLAFSITLVLIINGCTSDLPPEPGTPPGPIGEAQGVIPAGFSNIFDPFGDPNVKLFSLMQNIFNVLPNQASLNLDITANHGGGLIYKYFYVDKKDGWELFEFPDKTYRGSNWIKGSASKSLDVNTDEIFSGENDIAVYSCKKYQGVWKCGCNSQDGPCNQWMLMTYNYNYDMPAEPSAPVLEPTSGDYAGPNDVFDIDAFPILSFYDNPEKTFTLEIDQDVIEVGLLMFYQQEGYGYKYGYYWANNEWVQFEFKNDQVEGNWFIDRAGASPLIPANTLDTGVNYIAAYSCKVYNDEWKCGCTSQDDDTCNRWMIQTYELKTDLPLDPDAPGAPPPPPAIG
ncbi:hypothetical protein CMO93_03345 [Candidatus Woesearchaeota archaeon]|nr:hypothetical protein [Candidatus Woesearchaeota archaeon]|tara:strand:+ start:98 stop:1135 length:1038 start_codon:yes stop_codon:yes gene_type:complete